MKRLLMLLVCVFAITSIHISLASAETKEEQKQKQKSEKIIRHFNKEYDLTGEPEKDLPKVAMIYRQQYEKAVRWKHKIDNETTSDKYDAEFKRYRTWYNNEHRPFTEYLYFLGMQYANKHGANALRDLAIKDKFLDIFQANGWMQ